MLALQRSSMGSSKPPNLDSPFGYSFDSTSPNFPFPSPPGPAAGPSLLDDTESSFLDNFFEGVSNDQWDFNGGLGGVPDGAAWGTGAWADELPPEFMGTASSFGQQQQQQQQQPQIGYQPLPGSHFHGVHTQISSLAPGAASPSAEVLAAATALQNGSARPHAMPANIFQGQHMAIAPTESRLAPSLYQARSNINQDRSLPDDYMRDDFYTRMVFGNLGEQLAVKSRPISQKGDIRWGSDSAFGAPQGFVAPVNQEKLSALEQSHLQTIERAFEPAQPPSSVDSTRQSSPVPRPEHNCHQRTKSTNDEDTRARKRRKSNFQKDDDEDDDSPPPSANKSNTKKRKPSKKAISNGSPAPDSDQQSGNKRRKSAPVTGDGSSGGKAARENLTEDQKRENHIKSEQKRRTLIREGFEDLGDLVPGLRGGGFSKSAVLIMSADWLEELIRGNEALRGKLEGLQRLNGGGGGMDR